MKRAKGFTLVELVIVIVIVGILSIVAVPIYRGYTRKAVATEGKSLLGTIQTSQKVYFAEFAAFFNQTGTVNYNGDLDVDARSNKYFTGFAITGDSNGFTAQTTGNAGTAASGISLTLRVSKNGSPIWTDTGLSD